MRPPRQGSLSLLLRWLWPPEMPPDSPEHGQKQVSQEPGPGRPSDPSGRPLDSFRGTKAKHRRETHQEFLVSFNKLFANDVCNAVTKVPGSPQKEASSPQKSPENLHFPVPSVWTIALSCSVSRSMFFIHRGGSGLWMEGGGGEAFLECPARVTCPDWFP